ncbi:nitroreductase family protein [Dactylosporangium sp. CA-092794]|uniref:nitroreductase family protein n=1 Tax=Dactylosporangium sp. CA-092794 TaxID=3239929 RepID=UPI003D8D5218
MMTVDTTADSAARTVRDYVRAVFTRGRNPMAPADFAPDWDDAPSKYKTYPAVPRLAAPGWTGGPLGTLPGLLAAGPDVDGPPWTADAISALAGLAYGVQDRRLAANWNQDLHNRVHYPGAVWGRATASGGGMYPLEIYWVAGAGAAVRPGVYHFHTGHRGWQRLATGDRVDAVRAACLGDPGAARAGQFLVVTTRFWKNAFKYHDFCVHVVTQDLGALLGSWHLIARGLGRRLRPVLWFADEAVNAELGLATDEESALAVVPLQAPDGPARTAPDPAGEVAAVAFERSRRVLRLDRVTAVHRSMLVHEEPRPPAPPAPADIASTVDGVVLPELPAGRWETDLTVALRRRRSSFGRFGLQDRLTAADLGGVLGAAATAGDLPDDLGGPPRTGLHVLVNEVDGVPAGAYAYDPAGRRLRQIRVAPMAATLQRAYFLTNYNLAQAGAVVAISAPLDAALEHYGPRGYRLVNAEAGAAAQLAYVAAAALGVGCGAVLGFDNEVIDDALELTGTGHHSVLFLLLGQDRATVGAIDSPVAPPAG